VEEGLTRESEGVGVGEADNKVLDGCNDGTILEAGVLDGCSAGIVLETALLDDGISLGTDGAGDDDEGDCGRLGLAEGVNSGIDEDG